MAKTDHEPKTPKKITLPIQWEIPANIQSRYATNVIVQPGQHEIVISFFETQYPPLAGTPDQNAERLAALGAIRAECVGRIIVAPDQLPSIIEALQAGLDVYQASKANVDREE